MAVPLRDQVLVRDARLRAAPFTTALSNETNLARGAPSTVAALRSALRVLLHGSIRGGFEYRALLSCGEIR
jgi:hypothetical protein